MRRVFNQWQLIAVISLSFLGIDCYAAQPIQSHPQMMATDIKPISKLDERKVEGQQKPLPNEPLLFETTPNGPPSAMLRDQDMSTTYVHGAISALKNAEKPRPMPTESETH